MDKINPIKFEAKVWGETALALQQPLFSVHHLRINPHSWCSIHRHVHRVNAFHVLSGRLIVTMWARTVERDGETVAAPPYDVVLLGAGEGLRVPPGLWHQFATQEFAAEVLEVYFPVAPADADIERLTEGGELVRHEALLADRKILVAQWRRWFRALPAWERYVPLIVVVFFWLWLICHD